MADISLNVGGRQYDITCRDGDEPRLEQLAEMIDAKVQDARHSIPGINEVRQLLFAALFLADELNDIKAAEETSERPVSAPATDPRLADALESLANRVESLASRLAAMPENA
ncbi:cell division protein ZapA [Rhizorhapis sp. SPR117]|uniref:cell division protein ZapA n=1 Tax=Rhizorhapis sp. SPR117 TaxID=2912611 RepID=UPI001F21EF09|nr:cell division protein ZapA [Rhizorhapis sp. SPR117]